MKKNSLVLFPLVCLTAISAFSQSNNFSTERIINIDLTKIKGKLKTMFKEWVGAGRVNEGLRAGWQPQLAYVKKECGFKCIRMHGLLQMTWLFIKKTAKEIVNTTTCMLS